MKMRCPECTTATDGLELIGWGEGLVDTKKTNKVDLCVMDSMYTL